MAWPKLCCPVHVPLLHAVAVCSCTVVEGEREANTALIETKIKLKPENDPTVQEKQAVISVSMN